MNTIRKIGNAALQRVFKPEVTVNGTTEFKRTVSCLNDFNLWQQVRFDGYEETNEFINRYKMKIYLWGIELGLVEVNTDNVLADAKNHFLAYGGSLAECLSLKYFNEKIYPSHCVIVECFSEYWTIDKFGNDTEEVKIYSVSENNREELKRLYLGSISNLKPKVI